MLLSSALTRFILYWEEKHLPSPPFQKIPFTKSGTWGAVSPASQHSPWNSSVFDSICLINGLWEHLSRVPGMGSWLYRDVCPYPGRPQMPGSTGCELPGKQTVTEMGKRRVTRAPRSRHLSWRIKETKCLHHLGCCQLPAVDFRLMKFAFRSKGPCTGIISLCCAF